MPWCDDAVSANARFSGFDGLRAIAILLVILWHSAVATGFSEEALGPLRPLVMTGWAGVDLFFALSGFLIPSLILREEARNESQFGATRFSLRLFYARRALRILPVFFFVFALNTWILSGHLPSVRGDAVLRAHSLFGLWPYATFWNNYVWSFAAWMHRHLVDPGEAYYVYWSLCVEEHFYLLWPLFLTFVKKRNTRVAVALGLCVVMMASRYWAIATHSQVHAAVQTLSHYRMDSILWGAIGALVVDSLPLATRLRRLVLALLFATIALLVVRQDISVRPLPSPLGMSLGLTLLAVFSTGALIDLVRAPTSFAARVLEWKPLQFVGRMSYAMYLIHFQAINLGRMVFFSQPRAPSLASFLVAYGLFVLLTVMAATVLHFVVEKPFLRLRDRFRTSWPSSCPTPAVGAS